MPSVFGIDHKTVAATAIAVTAGVAVISSYHAYHLFQEIQRRRKKSASRKQRLLNQYLNFHYGTPGEIFAHDLGPKAILNFPRRCAEICFEYFEKTPAIKGYFDVPRRALDIGCTVGGTTFDLTRLFDDVIGIDPCKQFIDACNQLKKDGVLPYVNHTEGDIVISLKAKIPDTTDPSKASFREVDPGHLPVSLGQFGCVLAADVITRLTHPMNLMAILPRLVHPGGILVLTSPYTWSAETCDTTRWLGGFYDITESPVTGFETLKKLLSQHFYLEDDLSLQYLMRETDRTAKLTVTHVTIWRRKPASH